MACQAASIAARDPLFACRIRFLRRASSLPGLTLRDVVVSRASRRQSSLQRSGPTASWCARRRHASSSPQRQFKCQRLRPEIMRLAGGITQREVIEQKARHSRVLDDVLGHITPHHHGRNAAGFEVAGNQTGSLVANRAVSAPAPATSTLVSEASGQGSPGIDGQWLPGGCDWSARRRSAARPIADPTGGLQPSGARVRETRLPLSVAVVVRCGRSR